MSTLKAKGLKWELRNEGIRYEKYIATNIQGINLSIFFEKVFGHLFLFDIDGLTISSHHTLESAKEAAQLYADRMVKAFAE